MKTAMPAPATTEEVLKLRAKVLDMDALAQEGFDRIAAVSSLAIDSLESPNATNAITLLHALRAINYTAHDIMNIIGTEAEQVGCAYVDEAARRVIDKQFPAPAAQGDAA